MKTKQYTDVFKQRIIKECQEIGNVALVARRHEMLSNTIHNWMQKVRNNGSVKSLPRSKDNRQDAIEKQLKEVGNGNSMLKCFLTDKKKLISYSQGTEGYTKLFIADRIAIENSG